MNVRVVLTVVIALHAVEVGAHHLDVEIILLVKTTDANVIMIDVIVREAAALTSVTGNLVIVTGIPKILEIEMITAKMEHMAMKPRLPKNLLLLLTMS